MQRISWDEYFMAQSHLLSLRSTCSRLSVGATIVKDKRVKDIIEEAGGLLDDADTSNINLSEKLKDQMVVYVLKNGEKPKQIMNSSSSSNGSNSEVININTATKEQLMKISGIGKTKAEAIIEYREKNGDFKSKEDITKVKGIGKSTFEKIKDKIEV